MNFSRKHELYHNFVGQVELHNKNYANALKHLQQADPNDMNVKYHTAMLMDKLGKKESSKDMFTEVINYNFNNIEYALVRNDALKYK